MKFGDQVYKPVLDIGDTLFIVGSRLLNPVEIQKSEIVAIKVADGTTIHSFWSVDVMLCFGDEQTTKHCVVLHIDGFGIAIAAIFLRQNP